MALRSGHGTGRGLGPRVEVVARDLPQAVPEAAQPDVLERTPNGRFTSRSAKLAGSKGGRAPRTKADAKKLAARFGLGRLISTWAPDAEIDKFLQEAEAWFVQAVADMARDVGAGVCSAGVTSMLRSAAYARAYSNFLFDCASRSAHAWEVLEPHAVPNAKPRVSPRIDLVAAASRLADSSRQSYLAAFEVCAREAKSRPARNAQQFPWLVAADDEPEEQESADEESAAREKEDGEPT